MSVQLAPEDIPDESTLAVMTVTGLNAPQARVVIAVAVGMWPGVFEYKRNDGKQAVSLPLER
jgi:hypothetical protein